MNDLAAITIDVDSLHFYRAIHGLRSTGVNPSGDLAAREPIYHTALPRFFELLDEVGVPATLFLIGKDAARYPEAFRGAEGCEIANHSHAHDYRLSTYDEATIEADLARAEDALSPLLGGPRDEREAERVVGFRAPGYNVSPALLNVLVRRGYTYDSSLLPAPAYWAARAGAIGRYAWLGRPSASIVGHPLQFAGPLRPYRFQPAAAWRPTDRGLVEIPMAVTPWSRLPLIGTSWVMLPPWLRDRLLSQALRLLPVFNFEMHAIDLLDATDADIPPDLSAAQPDLRVPYRHKREAFQSLFRRMADARRVTTLAQIAETC